MTDWPKKGDKLVRGEDYDALAARLAEAERLLVQVVDYGLRPERVQRICAFLDGTTDSADVPRCKACGGEWPDYLDDDKPHNCTGSTVAEVQK